MNDGGRPRGLGRGLSALLGEPVKADLGGPRPSPAPATAIPEPPKPAWSQPIASVPPAASPNIVELPTANAPPAPTPAPTAGAGESSGPRAISIELIQRNPGQPRKYFDEAELNDLANSIRNHGVLQPILVRPIESGRFEIVAGERRWRAAQRAGLHAIPAVVRELDELEVLEIAIVENVQRTDLNPIEEAMGFQALIDRFGRTQQEIADAVGKSRPHIANMLRLLALPEELQAMVSDGRLTAGHARAILTAPDPMGLAKKAISEDLNVRAVERLAQEAKDAKFGPRVTTSVTIAAGAEKDADTLAMERSLSEALGLVVTITDKAASGGEVKIAYRTLEQLDDIARRLRGG